MVPDSVCLGGLLAALLVAVGCGQPVHVEQQWSVEGVDASADVYTQTSSGADRLVEDVRDAFRRVDDSMSNRKPDSELSRLNRRAGAGPYTVDDPDLFRCISMALKYAQATSGEFDPTIGPVVRLYGSGPGVASVPDPRALDEALEHVGWRKVEVVPVVHAVRFLDPEVELDLGSIAEGYAIDVAARSFARTGCLAGLLNLGGSLYAWNRPPGRAAFAVGVRDPDDPSKSMATLEISNRAAATVNAKTYGRILDPRTGRTARSDVVSSTVIADAAADADVLGAAIFVGGSKRASDYLRRGRRLEAILLVDGAEGRTLLLSASLEDQVEVEPAFRERIGGRVRYILPPIKLETATAPDLWNRLLD